jgi:hypothetical protein
MRNEGMKMKLTTKEKTTLVLFSKGWFVLPEYVIKKGGQAMTGWHYRLFECGYIKVYSGNGDWPTGQLTSTGESAVSTMSIREIYEAECRLRRLGYHLPNDPLEMF